MTENSRNQRGKEIKNVIFPIAESLSNMPEGYQKFIAARIKESLPTKEIENELKDDVDTI